MWTNGRGELRIEWESVRSIAYGLVEPDRTRDSGRLAWWLIAGPAGSLANAIHNKRKADEMYVRVACTNPDEVFHFVTFSRAASVRQALEAALVGLRSSTE